MINQHDLHDLLDYDPESGLFRWRKKRWRSAAGSVAGCRHVGGYIKIVVKQHRLLAHRMAWLYVHGVWPPEEIDHIDGNRANNAISNLRLASRAENQCNTGVPRNNTTGHKGIKFDARRGMWSAEIQYRRTRKWLGHFKSAEDASASYQAAARELFGEFRRT